jgi:TP901-1 family phage major tail protein
MAAQKGSDMLVKIGDGGSPTETFTSLAGIRTKTLAFNAEQVDITNQDSTNKWRELLAGAGIKSASLSGAGVFKDAAADETARAEFFAQAIKNYQVVIPSFGTIEGAFQLTQLQYAGEHNGEISYELSLESAGELTFTAA